MTSYTETVAKWVYRWWLCKIIFGLVLFSLMVAVVLLEGGAK